ncbi:hypothetical protein EDC94DRAFT_517778, partial [Helicostylum pulchrum]
LLHMTSLKDTCQTLHFLGPALIGAAMYICAVTVYIKRFPENFFPGKFDAAGMASHVYVCLSIFVSFVAVISLPIYIGSFHFYSQRESYDGCF